MCVCVCVCVCVLLAPRGVCADGGRVDTAVGGADRLNRGFLVLSLHTLESPVINSSLGPFVCVCVCVLLWACRTGRSSREFVRACMCLCVCVCMYTYTFIY
eukprot:GHVR01134197.1.p1 GENE.GHVR01134197.1~~GHVR01134197.1.p1  ORF type:complete len:101 (-),score=42.21 GHVR01134197.1:228-530(-)